MQKILQESGLKYAARDATTYGRPATDWGPHRDPGWTQGSSRVISKQDLGHFMLPSLTTSEYKGHSTHLP